MNILIYRYGSICEPDVKPVLKSLATMYMKLPQRFTIKIYYPLRELPC